MKFLAMPRWQESKKTITTVLAAIFMPLVWFITIPNTVIQLNIKEVSLEWSLVGIFSAAFLISSILCKSRGKAHR